MVNNAVIIERSILWSTAWLVASHAGCEYVRPTLNAPLNKWEPTGGYRFSSIALPEADNTDSLLFIAAFSGGGTRASTLAFGALRELAHQEIMWEGKKSVYSMSLISFMPSRVGHSPVVTMPSIATRSSTTLNIGSCEEIGRPMPT